MLVNTSGDVLCCQADSITVNASFCMYKKEKQRQDYTLRRHLNEKLSVISGCPGLQMYMSVVQNMFDAGICPGCVLTLFVCRTCLMP